MLGVLNWFAADRLAIVPVAYRKGLNSRAEFVKWYEK